MTTRRRLSVRRASGCTMLCAALSSLAAAAPVNLPYASEFESSMLMLTDIAMSTTHGPTSGEGVGLMRYDTGLYPPATIDLDLPELRGASPLAALRWSTRWREIIESVYGGDREMVNYWEQGAAAQGDPMFSVLGPDSSVLSGDIPRRTTLASNRIDGPGQGYSRAITLAQGGAISGGGGGGGQPLPIVNTLVTDDITIPEPIVDPVTLPPVVPAPAPVEPIPETPTAPVEPPRLVFNFGGIEWVNPNFNQNPPPPFSDDDDDDGPFDNGPLGGSTAPLAIPTPSAVGLGAAGLLAIGAGSRRRKLS